MQQMISALIEKGFAYATVEGDVYYRTQNKPDYGKLCHQNLDDLKAGERVDVDPNKESPLDFALWKHAKPQDQVHWQSPWGPDAGKGRPRWHIECSTMIHDVLGPQIDIHAGGYDLVFPHHENEIAQSEAFTGCAPFAKYWLHNGFVNVSGEKMSKSLGNFQTIQGLLKAYSADAIRYFVLTNHYRMPVDFSEEALDGAENRIKKMTKQLLALCEELSPNVQASVDLSHPQVQAFKDAMCSDMNTAKALASLNALFDAARQKDKHALEQFLVLARTVLGFSFEAESAQSLELPEAAQAVLTQFSAADMDALITQRLDARKSKNWALSDEIRDALKAAGVQLLDNKDGTTAWELI
jgi:cysteinyl-tRNA synthetase